MGEKDLAGMTICQFDGGAAQRLGVGGVLVWGPSGELWGAKAMWYGGAAATNNEAEVAALEKILGQPWLAKFRQSHNMKHTSSGGFSAGYRPVTGGDSDTQAEIQTHRRSN